MAQLNIRIPDAEKQVAEEVAKAAGFSLGEYLGTVVSYMATHRTLPVVIRFKPVAIKPEEIFQQAIVNFRNAYMKIDHLCEHVLREGEFTPLDEVRNLTGDIDAAKDFYEKYEAQIALAAGQLEMLPISSTEYHNFARCREHFPSITGLLRSAIRHVFMDNRPVNGQDIAEMRTFLRRAAEQINILQDMAGNEIASEALSAFFIRDVEDAARCALGATRKREAYLVRVAWSRRMTIHVRQAEVHFNSLGVVEDLAELSIIWTKLRELANAVHDYIERKSESMGGFDMSLLDELKMLTSAYVQRVSPPEK